jgi:hypothetical protein
LYCLILKAYTLRENQSQNRKGYLIFVANALVGIRFQKNAIKQVAGCKEIVDVFHIIKKMDYEKN